MADNSAIEWTDATWNPVTGCSVVSPGCTNCYAMRLAGTRLAQHPSRAGLTRDTKTGPVWTGEVRFNGQWLDQPLRWKRPRRVFVCAHADLFHEAVPDEWIDRVFAVMNAARQHTFQVLTKRAERMRSYMARSTSAKAANTLSIHTSGIWAWPPPNVWLGVSAEDQARADERIPRLLATPAAVRWVSAEPLLGPLDLWLYVDPHRLYRRHIDWVVAGGESGPGARPMHPDWARALRDQCQAAGTKFHFKQHGAWLAVSQCEESDDFYAPAPPHAPDASRRCLYETTILHTDGSRHRDTEPMAFAVGRGAMQMFNVGKKRAGRLLDGREWNETPDSPAGAA